VKNLTAEYLYTLVRDKKVSYEAIKEIEPKKFGDLEYTMKLIFNHEEEEEQKQFHTKVVPGDLIRPNINHSSNNNNM
jgi:hypothetical protein